MLHLCLKVAAMGLDPAKHLGKELAFLNAYLHKLKEYVRSPSFFFLYYLCKFFKVSRVNNSTVLSYIYFTLSFIVTPFCRLYGINVCGEGGEYETLTLDCPLFSVSSYSHLLGGLSLLYLVSRFNLHTNF